jgi:hypothetical protein
MNRLSWLLAGIAIAAAAFVLVLASPGASAWQTGNTYGGSGDWTINNPTVVGDDAGITVNGNLIINSRLEVYSSTIRINSASDNQYRVNVTSTGTLQMYGSTLTASNTAYHYSFLVWGSLDINQSSVAEMWGDTTGTYPWVGGIQMYKSGAQIRNSNIFNGRTGGIYIYNCSATVTGCSIYGSGPHGASTTYTYGIYVSGDGMGTATTTKIDGNYVYGNTYVSGTTRYGYGVYSQFQGSGDKITNNRIYDNGFTANMNSQGTQLRLQYSNATVTDNFLGNGSYQLYVQDSSPPTMKNMNFTAYAYMLYTTYGVYATNSTLTFDNCSWYQAYGMGTEYGVFSTGPTYNSSAFLTFKNCGFNFTQSGSYTRYFIQTSYTYVDIIGSTFTGMFGSSFYGVYCTAGSAYAGSTNISSSTFNITNSSSTTYMLYNSYCPLNISSSTFDLYMAGYSGGTVYMLYAPSDSNISIKSSRFTVWRPQLSANPTHYMFYINNYSPLTVEDSTIDFSVRVGTGGANFIYAPSYCTMAFYRSTVKAHNITAGSFYGIYTTNTRGNISFDRSNLIFSDIGCNSTSYLYIYIVRAYYADFYIINNTNYYIVNCRNITNAYYTYLYCNYLYYSSVMIDNSTFYLNHTLVGPTNNNMYGFYLYNYGQSGKFLKVINSTVFLESWNNNYGGWLFQANYGTYCYFSRDYINVTSRSAGNSIFYFMANGDAAREQLAIENCTIEYSTLIPQDVRGGIIFNYMYYMDVWVNDTTIVQQNLAGLYPCNFAYYLLYAKMEFLNSNISIIYGNGNGTRNALDTQPFYNLYNVYVLNFTNSMFKVSVINDPVILRTMYFYYYESQVMTLRKSKWIWDISAPNSVVYMMDRYKAGYQASLKTLNLLDGSSLEMNVNADNCRVQMLDIVEGGLPKEFNVKDSTVKITVNRPSADPQSAITLTNLRDYSLKGLTLDVNGPPLSVDPGRTTLVAGLRLVRSSATLDGITVRGNGLGKSAGIWCDVGSTPDILNCKIGGTYIGLLSTLYSQPTVTGCTITDCPRGIMLDLSGNATLVGTTIGSGALPDVTGVFMVDESWINLIDSTISTATDLDLDTGSTAWLLNATFSRPSVKLRDDKSALIVNWRQELWVTWQNDASIPGAEVMMQDALGREFMRATTDQDGLVPQFIVTEHRETLAGKTMYSPYKVNVSYGGFSGEDSVVTSKSQRSQIKIWDTALPVLSVVTPADNTYQNYRSVLVSGTASDLGSGIDAVRVSYDGKTWTEMPATGAWALVMDVPEGPYTLTVVLTDKAGNEASQTLKLTIDLTAPFIEVASPGLDSLGNVIGVDLSGRVEPGSALLVNHRPVDVAPDGSFAYGVRLVEGRNTFSFFATDLAGNTNSTEWRLYLDITPPPLLLSSPADGYLTNLTTVQVTGRTEPGATAALNGDPVEVGPDGSFSVSVGLKAGVNTLTVVATDPAGNRASLARTVIMDNEIALSVLYPTDNLATNQVTILVRGQTGTDVQLRLNDALVTVEPDGNFSVTYTLLEGLNELVFSARDLAGNSMYLTRRVVLDITPPSLELLTPQDGALLRTREVAVSGICEPGIGLTVNGEAVATDTGAFNRTLTLPEGRSLITLEGRDAAGNAVSTQMSVVIDLTAPSLEIVEPVSGFRTRDFSVVVVGITEPGASLTVNGRPVLADQFGKFTTSITLKKGKNDIKVVASDGAGNSVQKSVTVTGTTAPATAEPSNWLWMVVGLVVALGIMLPLTALLISVAMKGSRPKEGSK